MAGAKEEPTAELRHEWTKTPGGVDCLIHIWSPTISSTRAVIVLFHGLGGHGLFPTVRYLAELLVAQQLIVYSMDFSGHGQKLWTARLPFFTRRTVAGGDAFGQIRAATFDRVASFLRWD
jgi:predicted alpha/beta-fold hydrolase